MKLLKRLLTPLASLKLTVILLMMAMLLVYAGTGAQMNAGVIDVQHRYFHSLFCRIDLHTLLLRQIMPGKKVIGGSIPMLGGYSIGLLLLINLLSAHTVRFKMTWKRSGIILIHAGLIFLLVGEGLTSGFQVESRMALPIGGAADWTTDVRSAELAVIDTANPDHDQVTVIRPAKLIEGTTVHDARLPFDVKIEKYARNSVILPKEAPVAVEYAKATAGTAVGYGLLPEDPVKGVGDEASEVDHPSTYVTLSRNNAPLGTYLLSTFFEDAPKLSGLQTQDVTVDGHPYQISLRFKRLYRPYTIRLLNFEHDRYTGTDVARGFRSTIRLTDPAEHVDREVKISMNNPLRYRGETFYQQKFGEEDKSSTLQVVRNPAWFMPYASCAIGALGMVIHFGMTLWKFLAKRAKLNASPLQTTGKNKLKGRPAALEPVSDNPFAGWTGPLVACALVMVFVIARGFSVGERTPFDLNAWGQLPMSFEGRIQPLDSIARNALKVLNGRETFQSDGKSGPHLPASQWLADVLYDPQRGVQHKVIRIDAPDVKSIFTDDPKQSLFSPAEVFAHWDKFIQQLFKAQQQARAKSGGEGDEYPKRLNDAWEKVKLFITLSGEENAGKLPILSIANPELRQKLNLPADRTVFSAAEVLKDRETLATDLPAATGIDPGARTPYQAALVDLSMHVKLLEQVVDTIFDDAKRSGTLHPVPPLEGEKDWLTLHEARDAALKATDAAQANGLGQPRFALGLEKWSELTDSYERNKPDEFNDSVATYTASLERRLPADVQRTRFEAGYNHFTPFMQAMFLYVLVFVLICVSWLVWPTALYRTALGLALLAFAIHTGGLIARIYISGRPPVTNLASSAIFIAWGLVVLSGLLESVFRNSIGLLTASAAGFVSLLIADRLSLEGDTFKVLEAVLDTNIWLATHVVCITLGYSATFLAGVLGIVYIIRGFFDASFDKEAGRDLARMIYGIVCFAMLFSFVGTILGGIWADQSWGRFWGWDPKENGAVLIVLANALLLHARWGGVIRERGMALFAIFGNVVTAWSWFGTNMLGVGLHSYGFMPKALLWLLAFDITQILIIAAGLLPMTLWANPEQSGKLPLETDTGRARKALLPV